MSAPPTTDDSQPQLAARYAPCPTPAVAAGPSHIPSCPTPPSLTSPTPCPILPAPGPWGNRCIQWLAPSSRAWGEWSMKFSPHPSHSAPPLRSWGDDRAPSPDPRGKVRTGRRPHPPTRRAHASSLMAPSIRHCEDLAPRPNGMARPIPALVGQPPIPRDRKSTATPHLRTRGANAVRACLGRRLRAPSTHPWGKQQTIRQIRRTVVLQAALLVVLALVGLSRAAVPGFFHPPGVARAELPGKEDQALGLPLSPTE
jgi:hypothetical protein